MSDRSRYSPERRALFVALGALGVGLRPVLAADPAAPDSANARGDDQGDARPARPPIIIKGGSFFVELDNTEGSDFTPSISGYSLPTASSTQDLNVKVIGLTDESVDFKTVLKKATDVVLTLTPSSGTPETVTLSAKGTAGLLVTNAKLAKANDGPAARKRRLKHGGFGTDIGFWISRVEVKKGTTLLFAHEDPDIEYRLKVSLNET